MTLWLRALATLCLLAQPVASQTLDPDDPFQVLRAHLITVSTHLGDGRIRDDKGVRFAIQSAWAHPDEEMDAYADLIVDNPSKFTSDPAIIKLINKGGLGRRLITA